MDASELQKHTLAYIALFIGAGMLILWRVYYSIIIVVFSIIANIIFLGINSQLGIDEILVSGGLLTAAVMFFSITLIQTRYRLTKKEIIARLQLEDTNEELNKQKKIIEIKNESITDSIEYAKKIQEAILPSKVTIKEHIEDFFILYKPRDIVSGDFYWFAQVENKSIIAAIDCTGHGVPGAFMSMIGNSLLNKVVVNFKNTPPLEILFQLRKEVIKTLNQSTRSKRQDGMDMALCVIDQENQVLEFAGANNSLLQLTKSEILEYKADRMPIGEYDNVEKPFTNHSVAYKKGETFYIYTDGYKDQFGGPKNKKIGNRGFINLIAENARLPLAQQEKVLSDYIGDWMNQEQQLDDILVIGFKL